MAKSVLLLLLLSCTLTHKLAFSHFRIIQSQICDNYVHIFVFKIKRIIKLKMLKFSNQTSNSKYKNSVIGSPALHTEFLQLSTNKEEEKSLDCNVHIS